MQTQKGQEFPILMIHFVINIFVGCSVRPLEWESSLIYSYLYNQYPLNLWVWIPNMAKSTRCNIIWHICLQLKTGRKFSPVYPTNKTDRHEIIEILMEMALNITTLTLSNWSLKMKNKFIFMVQYFIVFCVLFKIVLHS